MKLESLGLKKFKDDALKKEQMFKLNGGGTKTAGGTNYNGTHGGKQAAYDYGYDVDRNGTADGITYHNRSNIQYEQKQIAVYLDEEAVNLGGAATLPFLP